MAEVVFKCKRSGNCVRFSNENDIAGMRKHEGYEEVTQTPEWLSNAPVNQTTEPQAATPKRRGRPRAGG